MNCPFLIDLISSLWNSSSLGKTPTPFPSRWVFPFFFCLNKLFLCFPTCCTMYLVIKFLPGFVSLKQSCFQTRARARVTLHLAISPWWSRARIPGFPPDYTSSIPGQGTNIQLQDHLLLSRQENNFQTTWTACSSIQAACKPNTSQC